MSKIKNGGLDQYGTEPFGPQQFGTAGVEGGYYLIILGQILPMTCTSSSDSPLFPHFSVHWLQTLTDVFPCHVHIFGNGMIAGKACLTLISLHQESSLSGSSAILHDC